MSAKNTPSETTATAVSRERLEYLRGQLRAERISYGELHELQNLAPYIDAGDVELLEAAGVPEFPDTIQTLAAEAAGWFETARRATGDTATGPREDGDEFVRTKDGEPDWVRDLVYAAHGGDDGMLPDHWRYACILAALDWIAENDGDPDDGAHEFADQYVDVYNAARIAWLGSHAARPGYCQEAAETFGNDDNSDIIDRIGWGQYTEAREVFETVLRTLSDRAEQVAS